MKLVVLAVTVAVLGVVAGQTTYPTKWDSYMGANFDLSPLSRSDADYIVTDGDIPCTPTVEKNYTYVFNVGHDVLSTDRPAQCTNVPQAPAIQYNPAYSAGECYSLGTSAAFSLIDATDPSKGVQLKYSGGQQCNHNPGNPGVPLYRSVTLIFTCQDVAFPSPQIAFEPSHCAYTVEMPTYYGCPVECPIGGEERRLCSGHGLCGYDQSNKDAKCFCDTGFGGADCSTAVDASSSGSGNGAIIGLLVTVLLIAVAMGVILFFVVRMLRAYRQDAHNYMAMHQEDLGAQDI